MSVILLDTNAVLWLLAEDHRLGPATRARLTAGGPVCFSSVSTLEVTMKQMLGRLELPGSLAEAAVASGLTEVAFTSRHADALPRFPELVRHDPFDRMLLAQALAEGMDLVTSDATLLALGQEWVIDARS